MSSGGQSAPTPSPLSLAAGDRFHLGRGARRGTFTLGRGLGDHGAVRVLGRGDVQLTLEGREMTVRPVDKAWSLVLLGPGGAEVARYTPHGTRRRHGTITTEHGTATLVLPRRRIAGELIAEDRTSLGHVLCQNAVVLLEVNAPVDTVVAAFAVTVVMLRRGYREPEPARIPSWELAPLPFWGGYGLAGSGHGHSGLDFSDFGGGGGDFGGGGGGGGGGDG